MEEGVDDEVATRSEIAVHHDADQNLLYLLDALPCIFFTVAYNLLTSNSVDLLTHKL